MATLLLTKFDSDQSSDVPARSASQAAFAPENLSLKAESLTKNSRFKHSLCWMSKAVSGRGEKQNNTGRGSSAPPTIRSSHHAFGFSRRRTRQSAFSHL